MKTLIAIPENKAEWKAVWENNKKKIIGAAAAVGLAVVGTVATHGKLWDKDDQLPEGDSDTAGYLPDGEGDNDEEIEDCPLQDEIEEESNESEGE